jgi:rhodanese-related sulfurtransferase
MPTIQIITPEQAKLWLDQGTALLIDVRESHEHQEEAILQATLMPLSRFNPQEIPDLGERKLILHCRSGKRSEQACLILLTQMPELEVYNLEGGILAWAQSGFPTTKSSR